MVNMESAWRPVALLLAAICGNMAFPMFDSEDDFMAIKRMMEAQEARQQSFGPFPNMPDDIRAFYEQEQEYALRPPEPKPMFSHIDGGPSADLLVEDFDWPAEYVVMNVGQVGGIGICPEKNVHVFHRANRIWEEDTFDMNNTFTHKDDGPIREDTIVVMSEHDGRVINRLGANMFFLPHGLTIDNDGNYWLTDVAMHQVFKYSHEEDKPIVTLGKAFEPATGNDDKERFCKPTDVAVSSKGLVFIADGYCNSRIVVTDTNGTFLGSFGHDDFLVPHSLALAEDLDLLCVADRDNERILLFNAGMEDINQLGEFEQEISFPQLGRVFGIAYSPMEGQLLAVTQASHGMELSSAYTINLHDPDHQSVANWTPKDKEFSQPHDIAVSQDGEVAYVGLVDTDTDRKVWKFDRP